MSAINDLGTKAYSGMGREGTPFIETLGPRIINDGILDGRSALSPSEHVWTVPTAEELIAVYVDSPDTSSDSFDNKLRKQVSTISREACLLFADLILLNLLPLGDYGAVRKRELIQLPIEQLDPPVATPADIDAALSHGMFRGGIGFKSGRFARLRWLITFAHYACGQSEDSRRTALSDPLSFREFVRNAPGGTEAAQRQSLLYLAFPWFYLPTIIPTQRQQIRDAFADECLPDGATDDVDIDLHRIYAQLTKAASGPIDFYRDPRYEKRWRKPQQRERRVWIFQSNPKYYDLREYLKKPDIGPGTTDSWLLRQHVDDVADGDTVLLWVSGPDAGIYATGTVVGDSFVRPREEWEADGAPAESLAIGYRLDRSLLDHPVKRENLVTDPILKELRIIKQPSGTNFAVTNHQWEMLRKHLDRTDGIDSAGGALDHDWLIGEIYWNKDEVDDLVETLRTRRPQVILAGPPGTGKTYVAEKVAKYLTGGTPDAVQVIQFHPSFAYEDFVEGLRPVSENGQVSFKVVEGKLITMADRARSAPDQSFVLVIDEINRANLPSVFGELLYLLEYRGKEIQLLHRESFSLPSNLYIIGTMNTADRSIRSVDTALRRRFDIFDCAPRAEILERYYDREENLSDVDDLVDGFQILNHKLSDHIDDHHTIGHSFFMRSTYTANDLRRTWYRQILPLLSEYFFDQPALVDEFSFDELWPSQRAT
ncbi:AAA family ATPase [Mycobacterium sp. DL440]|uniref:AAA family ATPase n=1 Tax=Mycobacterium sp. DL440 TaxID=2675523 RepID=UPI00141F8210|nr:AAA family ATPase [Mycobacterium sp. DL440]